MVDVAKLCRICIAEQPNLVDYKQTFESCGKKSTLKEIFNDCSPVKIIENDGFPRTFCISCLSDLLKTFQFRQKCLESHNTLKNQLKVETPKESPTHTKKRKLPQIDPNPTKLPKKEQEIDFENVIVKNEIIYHSTDDDEYEELEQGEDAELSEEVETGPSTSKNVAVKDRRIQVVSGNNDAGPSSANKIVVQANLKIVNDTFKEKLINSSEKKDHPDLGEFKLTVMSGYKNSSHIIFEANGFLYVNTRNTPNRRYLRCSTIKNCPGKACIDVKPDDVMEEYLYVYKLHNHPKETLHINKLRFLDEMRNIANSGNYAPKQIYEKAIAKYPDLKNIMPYSALSSRLYRLIGTQHHTIESLQKFGNFLLNDSPQKYCRTHEGKQFFQDVLIDEETDACSIVFANTDLIESMSWSNELFVDASFKIDFDNGAKYNFLTICISVNEFRFPICFAIMDTPTEEEYTKILTLFRDKYAPDVSPDEIVTDFNAELFKALSNVYKHANITGSLIHYIFYVYKQCNVEDIIKQIELKPECMKMLGKMFTLPILPPGLIPSGLEHLKAEAYNSNIFELFENIFQYLEDVWINGVTPQVFTTFCNLSSINENIFVTYKKIRDILSSNKKFGFIDINEKLLLIDNWVETTYKKMISGEKLQRQQVCSKYNKLLEKWWQPTKIEKYGFRNFFECLSPLVDKMTGLIWIWGLYNYDGTNDDLLITPKDYYGSDVTEQMLEENEVVAQVEVEDESDKNTVIMYQLIEGSD